MAARRLDDARKRHGGGGPATPPRPLCMYRTRIFLFWQNIFFHEVVDPSSGSPLLVSEDFAGEAELQALRIRTGGEVTATRAEQQATLQRFQGRAAQRSGFIRGGALLISGAGKAFGTFSANRKRFVR